MKFRPLINPNHERFAQGVAAGLAPADICRELGYTPKSIKFQVSRMRNNPKVLLRIQQIQERSREMAAVVLSRQAVGGLSELAAVKIRTREYRLSLLDDKVDRLETLIRERAAAAACADAKDEPGIGTGLLMKRGESYLLDRNVLSEMREYLKHAAIELGEWEQKIVSRTEDDGDEDLASMTPEQLLREKEILADARRKIDQLRNGDGATPVEVKVFDAATDEDED